MLYTPADNNHQIRCMELPSCTFRLHFGTEKQNYHNAQRIARAFHCALFHLSRIFMFTQNTQLLGEHSDNPVPLPTRTVALVALVLQ